MEEDNREKDITTGTQKLRGIRNSDLYKGLKTYSSLDKIEELEKLHNIVSNSASRSSWTGRSGLRDPSLFEVTYSPSVSYGDSVYDEGLLMDPTLTTVNNLRSEHLSAFTQAVNGIIKGAIIAGTTFVDGTFGLLYGVGQGIYNAFTDDPDKTFFSGFWDNPINHAVGNLNEAAENFFVNYRTEEQINGPWYSFDNLTSANFIFDTVVKNIGFTVGAAYSGGVYAKAINGIAKLINAGRITGATAETIEAGMKALESSTKVKATKMIVGAGMSAHAEAMLEAWHTYTDFKRIEGQKLNIKHQLNVAKAAEEFLSNGGVFNSDGTINLEKSDPNAVALFDTKMKTLENAKQTALKGIESEAKHAATVDGMLNIPILTFDNLFMFGKWYAGGYSAARNSERMITRATKEALKKMKEAAKVGDKSVEEEVTRIMKKALEGGYLTLTDAEKALVEEAPDYLLGKKTGAVWAAIKGPLREGNEEMAQGAASQGSMYYYSLYSDAIYEAALNPDSKKKVEDYLKSSGISIGDAISYGIDSYYGDINKWEEGFVGAITGLLGAPTFGSSNNRSESTYLGNSKWIGLTGGTIADVREFLKGRKMAEQSALKLNDYLKNGKLPADIKHLIAQTTFEDDMHKAIIHDDEKKYKDARTAAIFEMVNHFKRTGRIDLLQAAMKATTEFTDEDINQILLMTTKEVSAQEENVKKFRDEEKKLNELLEAIKQEKEKLELLEVSELYTYDVYKEDVANLEEQEQSIKELLDNVESKLRALNPQTISPYVHQDGTVFTADEIKQDLNHRIELFLNIIDTITLAQEEIDSVSEGTLTEELLDTLTWYRVMMRDWEKRSLQITNSLRDLLLSAINDPKLKEMLLNILDLEAQMKDLGVDPEEYKLRYGGRYDLLKSWKNYNDFLTMLLKIFNKEGVQVATTFADKTPLKGDKDNRTLGEVLYNTLIEAIDGRVDISREAKEKFKKDIKDLRDIGESYLEYNRLFDEYQKHPDRIDAAHSKSDKESYKKVKGLVNTNTIDWDSATPGKVAAWIKSNAKAIEDAGGFAKFYNSLTPKLQEKVKAAQEVIMGIDAINKEIDSSAMDDYLKSFLKKSLQKQEEKDLPNSVADMINNLQDAVREDLPGDVSVTYSEDASEEELLSYLESVQKAASEFLDDLSDKVVKSVNEASAAELRKMEEEEEKLKKMKEKVDKYGEEAEKKAQKEQEDKEEEMLKKAAKYGEEAERKALEEEDAKTPPSNPETSASTSKANKATAKAVQKLHKTTPGFSNRRWVSQYFLDTSNGPISLVEYYKLNPNAIPKGVDKNVFMRAISAIHKYLVDKGAYLFIGSELKEGETIYFTTDEALNKEAGTEVILMAVERDGKELIIGTMPTALDFSSKSGDTTLAKKEPGLKAAVEAVQKELEEKKKKGEPLKSDTTTTVESLKTGNVAFTNDDISLAETWKEEPLPIAVVDANGGVMKSAAVKNDLELINPLPGLIYVYVTAHNGTLIPMLCTSTNLRDLDKVSPAYKNKLLELIKEFATTTSIGSTKSKFLKFANVPNFHVLISEENGKLYIKFKWDSERGPIHKQFILNDKGELSDTDAERLFKAIASTKVKNGAGKSMYITTNVDPRALDNSEYLKMVGEVTRTNTNNPHTIDDWYTYSSLTEQKKEEKKKEAPNALSIVEELKKGESKNEESQEEKTEKLPKSENSNLELEAKLLKESDSSNTVAMKTKNYKRSYSNELYAILNSYFRILTDFFHNSKISGISISLDVEDEPFSLTLKNCELEYKNFVKKLIEEHYKQQREYILHNKKLSLIDKTKLLFKNKIAEITNSKKVFIRKIDVNENTATLSVYTSEKKVTSYITISKINDKEYYSFVEDLLHDIVAFNMDSAFLKVLYGHEHLFGSLVTSLDPSILDSGITGFKGEWTGRPPIKTSESNNTENTLLQTTEEDLQQLSLLLGSENQNTTINTTTDTTNSSNTTNTTPEITEQEKPKEGELTPTEKPKEDESNPLNENNSIELGKPEEQTPTPPIPPSNLGNNGTELSKAQGLKDLLSDTSDEKEDELLPKLGKKVKRGRGKTLLVSDTNEMAASLDLLDKTIEVINKSLPQLSDEDKIVVVKGLIKIIDENGNAIEAYGLFKNGILYISNQAPVGTVYHEAFHYVINTLLSELETTTLFEEATQLFGNISKLELEEKLAEAFRHFMLGVTDRTVTGRLKTIYLKLKHIILSLLNKESSIDNLFWSIYEGKVSNSDISSNRKESFKSLLISYKTEKLKYDNLAQEDKDNLQKAGISKEDFDNLSNEYKEYLLHCS